LYGKILKNLKTAMCYPWNFGLSHFLFYLSFEVSMSTS